MLNEVSQIDQSVHSDLPWGVVVYPDSTASEPVPVGDCQVGPSLLGLPADDLGDQGSIPHSHACRVELPVESNATSYTAAIYRGKVGPLDCPSVVLERSGSVVWSEPRQAWVSAVLCIQP